MDETTEFLAEIARYRGGKFIDYLRGARDNVIEDFVELDPNEHIAMVQFQAQARTYHEIIKHLEGCCAAVDAIRGEEQEKQDPDNQF